MKKSLMVMLFLLNSYFSAISQSPTDRLVGLDKYGQNVQPYFKLGYLSFHKPEFPLLKKDYELKAKFNIDTSGNIINLWFQKKYWVTEEDLPVELIDYLTRMLMSSNGKWIPEVRNCRQVVSDTITCVFDVINKQLAANGQGSDDKNSLIDPNKRPHPEWDMEIVNSIIYKKNHLLIIFSY